MLNTVLSSRVGRVSRVSAMVIVSGLAEFGTAVYRSAKTFNARVVGLHITMVI